MAGSFTAPNHTYYYIYDHATTTLYQYEVPAIAIATFTITGAPGQYTDVWVDVSNSIMYGVFGSAIRGHNIANPAGPLLYSGTLATPNRGYGLTGYNGSVFTIGDQYFTKLYLDLSVKSEKQILFAGGKDGEVYNGSWYVTVEHQTTGDDMILKYSIDVNDFPTGTPVQYTISTDTNLRIVHRGS